MKRTIGAVAAFNAYSLFLVTAFQKNTGYLFDKKIISDMRASGIDVDLADWGWNDHYIWRLFAACIVTAFAGFLCGAIAKDRGGRISAIANIPSIIFWTALVCLLAFGYIDIQGGKGFIVTCIIAIPLTTFIAYLAGDFGETTQAIHFSPDTVLGVWPQHWVWAIVPIYFYATALIFVSVTFVAWQLKYFSDMSILGSLLFIFSIIPIVAWIYPLRTSYKILRGTMLPEARRLEKALSIAGILVVGGIAAGALQFGSYWLLMKFYLP